MASQLLFISFGSCTALQVLLHAWLPALCFANHHRFSAFLDTFVPLWFPLDSCFQLPFLFLHPSSRIGLSSTKSAPCGPAWITPSLPPIVSGTPACLGPVPFPEARPGSEPAPGTWLWEGPGSHTDPSLTGQSHLQLLAVDAMALHEQRQTFFVSGAKDLADKIKRLR